MRIAASVGMTLLVLVQCQVGKYDTSRGARPNEGGAGGDGGVAATGGGTPGGEAGTGTSSLAGSAGDTTGSAGDTTGSAGDTTGIAGSHAGGVGGGETGGTTTGAGVGGDGGTGGSATGGAVEAGRGGITGGGTGGGPEGGAAGSATGGAVEGGRGGVAGQLTGGAGGAGANGGGAGGAEPACACDYPDGFCVVDGCFEFDSAGWGSDSAIDPDGSTVRVYPWCGYDRKVIYYDFDPPVAVAAEAVIQVNATYSGTSPGLGDVTLSVIAGGVSYSSDFVQIAPGNGRTTGIDASDIPADARADITRLEVRGGCVNESNPSLSSLLFIVQVGVP